MKEKFKKHKHVLKVVLLLFLCLSLLGGTLLSSSVQVHADKVGNGKPLSKRDIERLNGFTTVCSDDKNKYSLENLKKIAREKYRLRDEDAFDVALGWLAGDNGQGQDDYFSYLSGCAPINHFLKDGKEKFIQDFTNPAWGSVYSLTDYKGRATRANDYIRQCFYVCLVNLDTRPWEANGMCPENGQAGNSAARAFYVNPNFDCGDIPGSSNYVCVWSKDLDPNAPPRGFDGNEVHFDDEDEEPEDFNVISFVKAPITTIELSDGTNFTTTASEAKERDDINVELLHDVGKNSVGAEYSLYDRFGSNLSFVEYLGEATADVTMLDHVLSQGMQGKSLDEIDILDDVLLFRADTWLSNKVYKDRPTPLYIDFLKSGYKDERVTLFLADNTGKLFTQVHANILKAISSFIVNIMIFLISDKFLDIIFDIVKWVINKTDVWDVVKYVVLFLLAVFMIFFIISLVKHAKNYAVGRGSAKQFISRFLIGMISIGVLFMFLFNPTMFLNVSSKIATLTRGIFNEAINLTHKDTDDAEVVYSTGADNQIAAVIWKTSLFEPWCRGMFGANYKNLYTQYADVPKKQKLAQDYQPDHDNPNLEDESDFFYDSAGCTGDVYVKLGGTKEIRNWAAFALSTLSKYHIGMEKYETTTTDSGTDSTTPSEPNVNTFPCSMTTYRDTNLYADTFRWIDAKMNISPQYYTDEEKTVIRNYGNSRPYETHVYTASWSMLWNTIMLLLLLPVVIKRLVAFLRLMVLMVEAIVYCLKEFVNEKQGLSKVWVQFKNSIVTFFYTSLQLYILIFLYEQFVGKSFLETVLYIILVFVVSAITPKDIYHAAVNAKHRISRHIG